MKRSEKVIEWYSKKTDSIIQKYGPGPIVHFHTGIVKGDLEFADDIEITKEQLRIAQDSLLLEAARFWEAGLYLSNTVLDVGCGLGGGSIFWARNYGARVLALTNVKEHIPIIKRYLKLSGVHSKVKPILSDAYDVKLEAPVNAIVAVESICYLHRGRWLDRMSGVLRQNGRVFIGDSFTTHDHVRSLIDEYWMTRIGTLEEYITVAEKSGFEFDGMLDITKDTKRFWDLSIRHSMQRLDNHHITEPERRGLIRSVDFQTKLAEAWEKGELLCGLLRFVRV